MFILNELFYFVLNELFILKNFELFMTNLRSLNSNLPSDLRLDVILPTYQQFISSVLSKICWRIKFHKLKLISMCE